MIFGFSDFGNYFRIVVFFLFIICVRGKIWMTLYHACILHCAMCSVLRIFSYQCDLKVVAMFF